MKVVGVFLLLLAGAAFIGAVKVIRETLAADIGTYIGALVIPSLLLWWGLIALQKAARSERAAASEK